MSVLLSCGMFSYDTVVSFPDFQQGNKICFFSKASRPGTDLIWLPIQWVSWANTPDMLSSPWQPAA